MTPIGNFVGLLAEKRYPNMIPPSRVGCPHCKWRAGLQCAGCKGAGFLVERGK